MNSIRQRLLVWLLAGLAVILGLSGYATYRHARSEVNDLFDYQLQQTALALRSQNLLALAIAGEGAEGPAEGDIQIQIWDRSSGLIYISQRQRELPFVRQAGFSELNWRNTLWRIFSLQAGNRTVQVAQPLRVRLTMSADIALRNIAPFFCCCPAWRWWSGSAWERGCGHSPTSPGRSNSAPLRRWSRSGGELHTEVRRLIQALNDLLQRLGQALAAQRQFVADAAPGFAPRLPGAAQTELVRRALDEAERAEAIADLRAGLERASHLVDQLLAMARLDSDAATASLEPVDLLELARTVVTEYAPIADARGVNLGLASSEPATVAGDPANLRVLLGNLVDNAIRYTPAGGTVDAAAGHAGGAAVLTVTDTGPGIPPKTGSGFSTASIGEWATRFRAAVWDWPSSDVFADRHGAE